MLALSMNKKREFKFFLRILVKTVWAAGLMAILTSCGTSPGYSYTISGTVSGMIGSGLVLQDNGGDDRTITANGAFSFNTALTSGTAYSITVQTQPTYPSQTCVVSNGSGTISGSPVENVAVSCVMNSSPITVDPFGLFAYVSNSSPGNISAYTISQTTGALTTVTGSPFTAGSYPSQVTVDPSGNFAYVANMGGGNISLYTINYDGSLSSNGNAVTTGTYPASVTICANSSGVYAYVSNMGSGNITAFAINPSNGTYDGYVTGSPFTTGTYPNPVTVYPNSTGASAYFAYVSDSNDGNIWVYSIGGTNGALTNIQTVATGGTSLTTVTIDPKAPYAYASDVYTSAVFAFTIETDGTLTAIP